jgi:gluconate 5-dehydrogenase
MADDAARSRLGRGLASLIGDVGVESQATERVLRSQRKVPIEHVRANPRNPRKLFSDAELSELADSIRERGIIQPIVVRARGADNFEIIAGERRWRAAQRANLHEVPIVVLDVTDGEAVRAAVAAIEHEHGRLDILINNAGIQRRNRIVDFKRQDWDDVIATNLTAPYLLAQAVLPGMIARKSGKIVNIASLMSDLARPTVVPYTAAKGGVRQLTRGMAVELAPHNIQVNAISPGYFATEMNRALIDDAEFNAWVCKRTPAGRWGEPAEIAGLAVFLCSDAANYITGQLITIDGGMSVAL